MLHFLGEQRRAVHLDQAQYAVGGMQLVGALLEQRPLIGALGVGLERGARIVQGRRQFLGDDVQSLGTDVGHAGIVCERQAPKPLALRIFPVLPVLLSVLLAAPVFESPVLEGPVFEGSFKAGRRVEEVAPTVVVPPP